MDYNCYKQNFINYAYQPGNTIASFSMSDDDRVLSKARSNTKYPQLQLDRPSYQPNIVHGGAHLKTYTGTAYIVESCKKDDYAEQEAIMLRTETLMDGLIAYLDYLRKAKGFRVTQIGAAFPVRMSEGNNCWGWGINFSMEARNSYCHNDSSDVDVRQIIPTWVEGETALAIQIGETTYTSTWSEKHLLNQALESLMTAINTDVPGNITAQIYSASLILTHSIPEQTVSITDPSGGHSWDLNDC